MDVVLLWAGVIALAVIFCAAWTWLCLRDPGVAVVVVVAAAVFSSHVFAMLFAAGIDANVVRYLIPLKDLAASILAGILIVQEVRSSRRSNWLWLPAALLTVSAMPAVAHGLSQSPLDDVLLSVRNALLPFVAAVTGLLMPADARRRAAVGSLLVLATATVYALIEYFLPVSILTDVIGVGDYWTEVKEQPFFISPLGTELPGNFFTSSGSRRLSGSFGDPLSAGYALAAGLILAIALRARRIRAALLVLFLTALAMSFTRAGALIALGAILPSAAGAYFRQSSRQRVVTSAGLVGFIGAVLLLTPIGDYVWSVLSGSDSSTKAHLAFMLALDDHEYSVTGSGFGSAGAAVGLGTENVFVTIALQAGLIGLVLYVSGLGMLAHRGFTPWHEAGRGAVYLLAWAAIVVTMVVSEQLLTFNAGYIVLLMLFLGPWGYQPGERSDASPEPRYAAP